MRIAVIGAGRVGQALAGAFTRAGHEVMLSASSPESAKEKAQVVGASAAASNQEAGERAEVIVLAVWYGQHEAVAADIVDVAHGKVVVDVSVPVTADMSGLATEAGPSAAERLAERLPGGKIVKAFNTVFATVQAHPDLHGVTADAFVAADDSDVKRTVLELAASIGLRPIDAGPLRHARYLEAVGCLGIFLNVTNDCLAHGTPSGSSSALRWTNRSNPPEGGLPLRAGAVSSQRRYWPEAVVVDVGAPAPQ